ncbi:uncharacterized protein F5147DRAFT_650561 [Suillus discolor]|uniref:Uncharacterized protein n=1 Tax=Suillus discolor TaxID=1912936 RepID=A0A9P7FCS1_9AGAM|nr:uncharacterized protein F5147DRAFT_650561 [Suillus discolor]KAG2112990.1 hypothetical protein F5147DRAFT_650561 [Suillus discolor]
MQGKVEQQDRIEIKYTHTKDEGSATSKHVQQRMEVAQINEHWPHHEGSVRGLPYVTSARNLIVVSVSFRDEIKKVGDALGESAGTGPLHLIYWTIYNLIVEMSAGAPALGYIFFREHPGVFAAPNRLIQGIAGITANADDVLVVKHCQSKKNEVMDCDDEDIPWVNGIMKQGALCRTAHLTADIAQTSRRRMCGFDYGDMQAKESRGRAAAVALPMLWPWTTL